MTSQTRETCPSHSSPARPAASAARWPHARRRRGWRVVARRAQRARTWPRRAPGAARRRRRRRLRHRPAHRARAGRGGRRPRRPRPAASTTRAPRPAARCRRSPTTRWRTCAPCSRRTSIAPLALMQELLPALRRRGGTVVDRQLGCRGRAVRRLGRLRVEQGRARPADRACSASSSRTCTSTPSTRATCAPQCTSGVSRARTSPIARAGDGGAGTAAPDQRAPRRADGTGPRDSADRLRRGGQRLDALAFDAAGRARGRREARGPAATVCGCSWPARTGSSARDVRRPAGDFLRPATWSW